MTDSEEKFTDDIGKEPKPEKGTTSGTNHNELEDKWNEIQDEYMTAHPDIDMDDLYFEGGGFQGLIQKISDETGKSTEEVKQEIADW